MSIALPTDAEWDQLSDRANSANEAVRKSVVRDARAALKAHLTGLGFPISKGGLFDALMAAARAGFVPGTLIADLLLAINARNRARHSGAQNQPIAADQAILAVRTFRRACAVTQVLAEPTQTTPPNPLQSHTLHEALKSVRSPILEEREEALSSVVEVLRELYKKAAGGPWDAVLKQASDKKISGSLAVRLLLAIRLRNNLEDGKKYPFTDDDLVDGVSAACAIFGIIPATVPARRNLGGTAAGDAKCSPQAQANFDAWSRPTYTPTNPSQDGRSDQSDAKVATPTTVAALSLGADAPRSSAARSNASSDARGARYWVTLESADGRPYYQDYDTSKPITRTELRGSAPLDAIKALPRIVFNVEYASGIPYLVAVTSEIILSLDGLELQNGQRREITDALIQLRIGDLPPLKIRRIWHVPQ